MSLTAALETLGCKVNQYESSYFQEALTASGYRLVALPERADVYLVHSCAVTARAGFQTRQLLRRAQRTNPGAKIVVAGCYAQLDAERLAEERLATHILGNPEKLDLLDWLQAPGSLSDPCQALSDPRQYRSLRALPVNRMHSGRARAFLKLQDGCDAFCSYCVVPYTRGRSRSLAADEVRSQLQRYLSIGYREVVLSGIHLGQWGKDLGPEHDLATLLQSLDDGTLPPRIRLSSLESTEWSPQLLKVVDATPQICPHFHVPLQSGDQEILRRMNRPYLPEQYAELIERLHRLAPRAALGADVLVGFPGETERHFRNTLELVRRLPLTYLHVFPYSPRPGTAAAACPDQVNGREVKARTRQLRDLDRQKRLAFWNRFVGEQVQVLVETQPEPGCWQGTSDNYLQVRFTAARALRRGSLAKVRIKAATDSGLEGEESD